MTHDQLKKETAVCGIACFACPMFHKNISEEVIEQYATATGLSQKEIPCSGCRSSNGCRLHYQTCETLECTKIQKVDFCFECSQFPCDKLLPCQDGASKYPHNMKLFNLCRIQQAGLQAWACEVQKITAKYYRGKLIIGQGPKI